MIHFDISGRLAFALPRLRAAGGVLLALFFAASGAMGVSLADLRSRRPAPAPAARKSNHLFTKADAEFAFDMASELVKRHTPRHAGTPEGASAARWIWSWAKSASRYSSASLDAFSADTPQGARQFHNVAAAIPASGGAPGKKWIVILSHFDTTPHGGDGFQGANDGASTTGLLLALQKAFLRSPPKNFNILLLWTDAEEAMYHYGANDGFQGAKHALGRLQAVGMKISAAIGLDMLGDRDLDIVVPANGDKRLKAVARAAAPDIVSLGDSRVLDDFAVFHDAGIPAIDLIDFNFGPGNSWWHTPEDSLDKISADSLFRAGNLVFSIVKRLDESAAGAHRPAGGR